jgi:hypothetical protein
MFRYYALTSARSLGRTGLRVAIGESARQYRFGLEPSAFESVIEVFSARLNPAVAT